MFATNEQRLVYIIKEFDLGIDTITSLIGTEEPPQTCRCCERYLVNGHCPGAADCGIPEYRREEGWAYCM